MKVAVKVVLTESDRSRMAATLRSRKTPVEIVRRVRIVAGAAKGLENKAIAERLGTTRECVGRWRTRFVEAGFEGLLADLPRSGRPRTIDAERRAEVVAKTTQEKPTGRSHWSRASMAKAAALSESTIGRIWRASGLKPHRSEAFKLSNDKNFEEKLRDVVGLYLAPPANAVVFACDEKSQIQALDRTQPGLPLKKGRAGTMTHDYKRHGTTTLFAALNVLTGAVYGVCKPRHTQKEWLAFIKDLDKETPKGLELHVICDNYATHKAPAVKAWLAKHARDTIYAIVRICSPGRLRRRRRKKRRQRRRCRPGRAAVSSRRPVGSVAQCPPP